MNFLKFILLIVFMYLFSFWFNWFWSLRGFQLNNMKKFLLFICIILSNNIFSQEVTIATKFIDNGSLLESLDELNGTSHPKDSFEKIIEAIKINILKFIQLKSNLYIEITNPFF